MPAPLLLCALWNLLIFFRAPYEQIRAAAQLAAAWVRLQQRTVYRSSSFFFSVMGRSSDETDLKTNLWIVILASYLFHTVPLKFQYLYLYIYRIHHRQVYTQEVKGSILPVCFLFLFRKVKENHFIIFNSATL